MYITTKNILRLIEERGTNARQLSIACGLNHSAISEWKKGKSNPSDKKLQIIADYFCLPLSYFYEEHDEDVNKITPHDKNQDIKEAPIESILPGAVPATEYQLYRAPIIGTVRAGFGSVASEDILGYDYLTSHDLVGHDLDEFFFLRVKGDSMEPELHEGDRLLVRRQISVDNNSLAVVIVDNEEGTVKNIKYGKNWIQLSSINPDYPPRVFEGQDVTRVNVIGLVKKIIRLC